MSNIIQLTNAIIPIEGSKIVKISSRGIYVNYGEGKYKIRYVDYGLCGDKIKGIMATSLGSNGETLLKLIGDNLIKMFYKEINKRE